MLIKDVEQALPRTKGLKPSGLVSPEDGKQKLRELPGFNELNEEQARMSVEAVKHIPKGVEKKVTGILLES